jgi:hypothetical protein
MALRVAFLEGTRHDSHVGPPIVDPELAEMTIDEWIKRIEANGSEVDELTGSDAPAFALVARRLAPDARVFAISGLHGLAVALVWETAL